VAVDAAKSRFSPEFMNRIDKVIVFRTLNREQLAHILDIELAEVQRRILNTQRDRPFAFHCTPEAKEFLLNIERHLVSPLSGLISTEQIIAGDRISVHVSPGGDGLAFSKDEMIVRSQSGSGSGSGVPPSPESPNGTLISTSALFRSAIR
jgi:ATP-dependent Clp protease ATP-binding subunit ClpB